MIFTSVNLRGNAVDPTAPNDAWFELNTNTELRSWANPNNDRWLFYNHPDLKWVRVKPVNKTYRQFLKQEFDDFNNPAIYNMTDTFLECGQVISEDPFIFKTLIESFVVPVKNGFFFVQNTGTIRLIYITETDTRLDSVKRMRNFFNELLMLNTPSVNISKNKILQCGSLV